MGGGRRSHEGKKLPNHGNPRSLAVAVMGSGLPPFVLFAGSAQFVAV